MPLVPPTISATSETPAEAIILIVGTDAETRLLYRLFLELCDFKIVESDCFNEMLAILEYCQPELILMDGNLSFEDDLEMIQQIRGTMLLQKTPLVLASGHAQAKVCELMLRSGVDDCLVKPLDYDALRNNLQRNIGKFGRSDVQGGIA